MKPPENLRPHDSDFPTQIRSFDIRDIMGFYTDMQAVPNIWGWHVWHMVHTLDQEKLYRYLNLSQKFQKHGQFMAISKLHGNHGEYVHTLRYVPHESKRLLQLTLDRVIPEATIFMKTIHPENAARLIIAGSATTDAFTVNGFQADPSGHVKPYSSDLEFSYALENHDWLTLHTIYKQTCTRITFPQFQHDFPTLHQLFNADMLTITVGSRENNPYYHNSYDIDGTSLRKANVIT